MSRDPSVSSSPPTWVDVENLACDKGNRAMIRTCAVCGATTDAPICGLCGSDLPVQTPQAHGFAAPPPTPVPGSFVPSAVPFAPTMPGAASAPKKTSKLPFVIGGVAAVAVIGIAAAFAVPVLRTLLAAPFSAAGAAVSATPSPAAVASSPAPAPSATVDARPTATVTVTQEPQPAATVVVPPAPVNVQTFPTVRVPEGKECARTGSGPFAAAGTANASTSCPFAINVRDAYVANLNGAAGTVRAYSPTTKLWYDMKCSGSQPVLCTGGKAGRVIIYGGDLKVG